MPWIEYLYIYSFIQTRCVSNTWKNLYFALPKKENNEIYIKEKYVKNCAQAIELKKNVNKMQHMMFTAFICSFPGTQ